MFNPKLKTLAYSAIDQGGNSLGNLAVIICLGNIMSVAEFGTYSLIWMLALLMSSICCSVLGLYVLNNFDLNSKKNHVGSMNLLSLSIIFLVSVMFFLLYYIIELNNFIDNGLADGGCLIVTFYVFSISLKDYCRRYYRTCLNLKFSIFVDLSFFVALFLWFFFGGGVSVNSLLLSISVLCCFSAIPFFNSLFYSKFSSYQYYSRVVFNQGFPSLGVVVCQWFGARSPYFILAAFSGGASVASLRALHSIFNVVNVAFQVFEFTLPGFFRGWVSKGQYYYFNKVLVWSAVFVASISILAFMLAYYYYEDIYNGKYHFNPVEGVVFIFIQVALSVQSVTRILMRCLDQSYRTLKVYFCSLMTLPIVFGLVFVDGRFEVIESLFIMLIYNTVVGVFLWKCLRTSVN